MWQWQKKFVLIKRICKEFILSCLCEMLTYKSTRLLSQNFAAVKKISLQQHKLWQQLGLLKLFSN